MTEFVEQLVDATNEVGKCDHVFRQPMEGGVGGCCRTAFSLPVFALVFSRPKEFHNVEDGFQGAAQVEELTFFQVSVFQTNAGNRCSHVKEIIQREIVFFLLNTPELTNLQQPFVHLVGVGGKSNLVDTFTT